MESVDYWVTDDGVVHFDVRCRICGCRNKYGSVEDLEKGWTCGSCVDCPPWSYVRALEDAIIGVLQDGDLNHLQAHNPVKGREK